MTKKQALDNKRYRFLLLASGLILLGAGITMAQFENKEQPTVTYTTQPIEKNVELLQGNWQYMPGVKKSDKGLLVQHLDYVIVEQNGKVAQKNPPVNTAGTHIEEIQGDFSITAAIDLLESTSATIHLYGNVPIIADEFRIERESISISATKNALIIKVWNGKIQDPIEVREFRFAGSSTPEVTMLSSAKKLEFQVDGKTVGEIANPGLFASGKIWFGLDAQHKEWQLVSLLAEKMNNGNFVVADGSSVGIDNSLDTTLKATVQRKREDFIVGGAMALGPLTTDPKYAQTALGEFNSMTPENDMKMINLQPKKGVYTFEKADALVHIAKENSLRVHGHTLVYGESNPTWVTSLPTETIEEKQEVENVMNDHVQTVVSHFGKDILSWDVVNEPLADYDAFEKENPFREHTWYRAMGESYIISAIETAHRANPDALLFINEYGLEEDGERWNAMLQLLARLKPELEERDIPVEKIGIGFQSHIYEREDRIDAEILRKHIQQLEQLGFKAQISELDVYSDDGDRVQAEQYTDVLRACIEESTCVAWKVWIITDRYNYWKNENGQILNGKDGLYDVDVLPRPARASIQRYLTK
jgi:endo-1,4-beta-xylanase